MPTGTSMSVLVLPDALTATVAMLTDFGGPVEAGEYIPVAWNASPAYDGDADGTDKVNKNKLNV